MGRSRSTQGMTKERAMELIEEISTMLFREDIRSRDKNYQEHIIALNFAKEIIDQTFRFSCGEEWPKNLLTDIGYLVLNEDIGETEDNLMHAIDSLNDKQREVILYRYRNNLNLAEIGKKIGFSSNKTRILEQESLKILRHPTFLDYISNGRHEEDLYIWEIGLSPRILTSLKWAGYEKISDFEGMTFQDMLKIRGLGEKSVSELTNVLIDYGIKVIDR